MPFHWGGGSSANPLTNPALDPTCTDAGFKVCAVAVARVDGPAELIAPPAAATQPRPTPHEQPTAPEPHRPSRTRSTRVKSSPRFLQGVFPLTGEGLAKPGPIDPALNYTVPQGASAQALYFRGGNSTGELVYVLLVRDGEPMRWFPIGARSDTPRPPPGGRGPDRRHRRRAARRGARGVVGELVIDLGLVEV